MKALTIVLFIVIGSWKAYALDVILQWDPSPEADLDHYTVYRAQKTERTSGPWQDVATVPKETPQYTDTVPDQGNYTWYVTAWDTAGNESRASNTVDLYDRTPPGQVQNVRRALP